MGDLLNIYKIDKEAKLKTAEEELQRSQSKITQLMQEKVSQFHVLLVTLMYFYSCVYLS